MPKVDFTEKQGSSGQGNSNRMQRQEASGGSCLLRVRLNGPEGRFAVLEQTAGPGRSHHLCHGPYLSQGPVGVTPDIPRWVVEKGLLKEIARVLGGQVAKGPACLGPNVELGIGQGLFNHVQRAGVLSSARLVDRSKSDARADITGKAVQFSGSELVRKGQKRDVTFILMLGKDMLGDPFRMEDEHVALVYTLPRREKE